MKFRNIFRNKLVERYGIVITRKSVFEDMETGFSSLEILREPESMEDQLT